MDERLERDELISALADGQLQGEALARALDGACGDPDAQAAWQAYHVIGDVLRSAELAPGTSSLRFLDALQARLADEPLPRAAPAAVVQQSAAAVPVATIPTHGAANDGAYRWKLVAGFASVAAVAAVGWSVLGGGAGDADGARLARASTVSGGPAAQALAQMPPGSGQALVVRASAGQAMIRDPRLDELLAAHRQRGSESALQMPAGFLRNATFEAPDR